MRNNPKVGDVLGCDTYGPCHLEEHHPDLYWYGVHGVETLFTIMGTGCQSVSRIQTEGTDLAAGVWTGGRVGTFRGIRAGKSDYGATVFGSKGIVPGGGYSGYEPLVVGDLQVLPDRQAPRFGSGNDRNLRLHGGRR